MGGPRDSITCVDCGGDARLIGYPPEDGRYMVGDVVTYRCRDCRDRWDLVLEIEDLAEPDDEPDAGSNGQPMER